MRLKLRVAFLCPFIPLLASSADYDVVIRNGRVIDGAGNPAFFADVGVKDGRIAAIGKLNGTAPTVLDAKGLLVAPGFIDVHTHAENIQSLPLGENFARMGVTTLVLGNCGGSTLNVAAFFRRLEDITVSVNVATLIGHNTIRSHVMGGSFMRPPTDDELAKMKSLVDQAMQDGAVGLSTGLIYLPGTFAKTEEIIELAKVASAHDGVYVSHMRDEGLEIFNALDELFRIAREAGIRAHISHVKLSGKTSWGQADRVIAAIEAARAGGLDITQDQYAYTASSTGLAQLVPEKAREGGNGRFVERLNDPAERKRITEEMKEKLKRQGRDDYAYAVIANYEKDPSLNGKNVVEAARLKRGSGSLDDQIDLILEIQKTGGASGVFHSMNEEDLQSFLAHPNTMIASDSSVRKFEEGVPHPRGYGNNARVLTRYVRELKRIRIEDAIRRMTSLPATVFRLQDRGELREGNWADIAVFDPAKVHDTATFTEPHSYSSGFAAVLVNGVVVIKEDRHTGARPGQTLRHRGR